MSEREYLCEYHRAEPNPNYPCYDCAMEEVGVLRNLLKDDATKRREGLTDLERQLADEGCPRTAAAIHELREAMGQESAWAIYIAAMPKGGWLAPGTPELNPEQRLMTLRMLRRLKETFVPDATYEEIANAPGRTFEGHDRET